MNRKILCLASVFVFSVAFWPCTSAQADDWSIDDLGTLPGAGPYSSAMGINTVGWVVGDSIAFGGLGGVHHAFLYDGTMRDLGTLGGTTSYASAINVAGWIVGASTTSEGVFHAFLYDGTMRDLGTLPGGTRSEARGINEAGWVVGYSQSPTHAFLYDGTMRDLGTLPGGTGSEATGINAAGWVVGTSNTFDGASHAFLYDGTIRDLGTLPGGSYSSATGINDAGWVVGWGDASDGLNHAFLYDGTMRDLGVLPGTQCMANGINAGGWVVGVCGVRAVLYNDSGIIDLSALTTVRIAGWENLDVAWAINDAGQIVGRGVIAGQTHAFRLNPPSPPDTGAVSPKIGSRPVARHVRDGSVKRDADMLRRSFLSRDNTVFSSGTIKRSQCSVARPTTLT